MNLLIREKSYSRILIWHHLQQHPEIRRSYPRITLLKLLPQGQVVKYEWGSKYGSVNPRVRLFQDTAASCCCCMVFLIGRKYFPPFSMLLQVVLKSESLFPYEKDHVAAKAAAKIQAQDFSTLTPGHPLSQERLPAPRLPLPCHFYEKKRGLGD